MADSQSPFSDRINRSINKQNCYNTFLKNAPAIRILRRKFMASTDEPTEAAIVVLNMETERGRVIASKLVADSVPRHKNNPFVVSNVSFPLLGGALREFDDEAADKLYEMMGDDLVVVVVDYGVAEVFSAMKAGEEKK